MTLPHSTLEAKLEKSLREIGIPPRPAILDHIRSEMQKDEPDFNQLARLVASDVALTASLISITNSPFFGFRGRVNTPREALMMLGLNAASKAIAGIAMRQAFPRSPHLERFRDASARIARLSGWLAQSVTNNKLRADDAYTFGLFRDCGIPILLTHNPDYFEILNRANHEAVHCFTEIEDSALPTNHTIVGSLLAQSWWLTEDTCLSIRNHHGVALLHTPNIPPSLNSRQMIAVAQLAEYLLQAHSGLSYTQEWGKLGPGCMQLLNLTEEDMESILAEAIPVIEAGS